MHRTIIFLSLITFITYRTSPTPLFAESAAAVAAKSERAIATGQFPSWWIPHLPDEVDRDVQQKSRSLANSLQTTDLAASERVSAILKNHFARVWAWHEVADERLRHAWSNWEAARDTRGGKTKDELRALAVATEQIDPIYAEFTPQLQRVVDELKAEVGEEKTTQLIDRYTRSPGAERTYQAYLGMVPEMTPSERKILWDRLAQARLEAFSAWSGKEIIKIFKKYKVRNEFSIDYFGYDYRKRYQEWAKRQSDE